MNELSWDQVEHGGRLAEDIWRLEPAGTLSRQDARVIADALIEDGWRRKGHTS